jgi:plastocyanin
VHATNVASRTLQGIAEGTVQTRYGFEYTIPISLGRFFSRPAAGRSGAAYRGAGRPSPAEDSRQEKKRVVVDIRSLRYARGRVEIDAGTTVVWRNRDPLAHTVTGDSAAIDSGEIGPDKDWSHTFTTAGTFSYHCTPHPHMKATVVVRPSSASKEKS